MTRNWIVGAAIAVLCLSAAAPGVAAPAAPAAPGAASPPSVTRPLPWPEARARPILKISSRGPWVTAVQKALRVRPVDGIFGPITGRAVKRFRGSVGLRRKAKVNARTWRKLGVRVVPPPPISGDYPTLVYGHSSAWVASLQEALGVTPQSGWFGPLTLTAVKSFQKDAGLPASGVVDQATWTALGDRVTPPTPDLTASEQAKASRSYRASIGAKAFLSSWTARLVISRESGGDCAAVSSNGTYRGKWQMDSDFWSYYGGLAIAKRPDLASCHNQDLVAYKGWVDRWWQPWPTAIP
ncbi:MAG: peptidoglycan-binding protein [Candidatus Nanopelagicales bacterium]|nr:peptidoglycan-binding protein [Candidatus Nanopelagicales bacterium]MDZ4249480.1 peptidoglycan-binding protein [Candidatus Nanopelagicales bacterium]